MKRPLIVAGISLAALLLVFVGGLSVGKRHADAVMSQAQTQIKAHQEAEDAAVATAGKLKQDADDADARAVDAGREVSALKAKLAKLRGQGNEVPPDSHVPEPSIQPDGGDAGSGNGSVLVNLQDAVIAAQDKQIGALTDENKALRGALAASEEARKQADIKADIQAQASKAALEGMKKAKWLDRLAWGGAGLATGYVTGRLQR